MSFDLTKLSFNKIMVFLAAAKHLNFTAAAAQLHVTQPLVSRTIARMEEDLGFPLFVRTKHTIALTSAGQTLRERLTSLVEFANLAYDEARSEHEKGIQSFCVSDYKYRRKDLYFDPIVSEFHNQCPEIHFTFRPFEYGTTPADILNYNIDIGFFGLAAWSGEKINTGPHIKSELLLTIPQKLFMGCKCPLYHKNELEITDLEGIPLVICNPANDAGHLKDNLGAVLAEHGITHSAPISYTSNIQASLYSIALSSNACAMTDDLFAMSYIQDAKSVPIKGLYNRLYALVNLTRANKYTEQFMRICRRHFASLDPSKPAVPAQDAAESLW